MNIKFTGWSVTFGAKSVGKVLGQTTFLNWRPLLLISEFSEGGHDFTCQIESHPWNDHTSIFLRSEMRFDIIWEGSIKRLSQFKIITSSFLIIMNPHGFLRFEFLFWSKHYLGSVCGGLKIFSAMESIQVCSISQKWSRYII